jgi:hypothetical protein
VTNSEDAGMTEPDMSSAPSAQQHDQGGGAAQSLPRLLVAAAMSAVAALSAAACWAIFQAQYVNDYCTTRVPQPVPANPEALGGRPAYMPNPVTIRCEYDRFPTVDVMDPMPLLGALVMVGVVAVVTTLMFRWARRPANL